MHKVREARPPEFSSDKLASLEVTGMAGGFMIVAAGKDGTMEGVLRGDIDVTFVGQDVVIKLPIREVGAEGGGEVLQGRLQVLEDEGVGFGQVTDAHMQLGVNKVDEEGVGEEDS